MASMKLLWKEQSHKLDTVATDYAEALETVRFLKRENTEKEATILSLRLQQEFATLQDRYSTVAGSPAPGEPKC